MKICGVVAFFCGFCCGRKRIYLSVAFSSSPGVVDHRVSDFTIDQSSLQFPPAAAGQRLYVMDVPVATISTLKRIKLGYSSAALAAKVVANIPFEFVVAVIYVRQVPSSHHSYIRIIKSWCLLETLKYVEGIFVHASSRYFR